MLNRYRVSSPIEGSNPLRLRQNVELKNLFVCCELGRGGEAKPVFLDFGPFGTQMAPDVFRLCSGIVFADLKHSLDRLSCSFVALIKHVPVNGERDVRASMPEPA